MIAYQAIIDELYSKINQEENLGQVAQYIPELARIDPNYFGVYFSAVEGESYGIGDWQRNFSIQSISKVLTLSIAYRLLGDTIWKRVGVEPSGSAFNSLIQLETDKGIPRNPMINGGAMVICDMLLRELKNPMEEILQFIRKMTLNNQIDYSDAVFQSEKLVGYRNIALCNFIKSYGNIENSPEEVLDFYFKMCSIEMNCQELTQVFSYLVNSNVTNAAGEQILSLSQAKRVNAIMQTCGFYDESGEFSFKVGLPGKSGVGGGIIAVHPNKYSIAVWSPKLNAKGNSYRGMKFLEQFTTKTELSIF